LFCVCSFFHVRNDKLSGVQVAEHTQSIQYKIFSQPKNEKNTTTGGE